jgi:O-antigen ligase
MRFVGIILVLLSLPGFILWLKSEPRQRKWAYALVGSLPFTINAFNLDAALVDWAAWPGFAKGMVITLLDSLALAIIAVSRSPFKRLPLLWPFVAYLLAAALSVAFSNLPMGSSFYVVQLVRIMIVFVAVAAIIGERDGIRWLAIGLASGALVQALFALNESIGGALQASGTMGHQNLLGMMLHFVTLPLLGLMLGGERSKLIAAGVAAALLTVALGASRGSVAFVGIGLALTVGLSLVRRSTPRKWQIVGAGALVLTLVAPIVVNSFAERFAAKPLNEGVYDERAAFEAAAMAMWADHPMGVGANQYVVTANTQGYSAAAGVAWGWGSRSAHVHNLYLLTAAELGWLGLVALLVLFVSAVTRGLLFVFKHRRDPRGDFVLGATMAIAATALHGLYEWVFVTYQAQYVFAIALGIIAGVIRESRRERFDAMRLRRVGPLAKAPSVEREPTAA